MMITALPDYLVPKSLRENIAYRRMALRLTTRNPTAQAAVRQRCSEDILYWLNTFGYTYDPRRVDGRTVLPFITYAFQDEAIAHIRDHVFGQRNLLIEKSRDMGASWISLMVFTWFWLFRGNLSFLLVSRKEDYVDQADNPDCLFYKIMFCLDRLPAWMVPAYDKKKLMLRNLENESTIRGESTTGNVGRGGRSTAALFDEFAAVKEGEDACNAIFDNTGCVVFNSTPQGVNSAFYRVRQAGRAEGKGIDIERMHWTRHPEKNKGLYRGSGNDLLIIDKDYAFPDGFPFIRDGVTRSPWYDLEEPRRGSKMAVAQELDIDYAGSGSCFFDTKVIMDMIEECEDPYLIGEIEVTPGTESRVSAFVEKEFYGSFSMWTLPLAGLTFPPDKRYIIGVDVSQGTGASQSVAAVLDVADQRIVAEYVTKTMNAPDFARVIVALARAFNNAFLIWEANGPGQDFGGVIVSQGYANIYFQRNETSIRAQSSLIPGFWTTPKSKEYLIGEYRNRLGRNQLVNPSAVSLRECLEYEYSDSGLPLHVNSTRTGDPSGRGANHGDRVIAAALASHGLKIVQDRVRKEAEIIPVHSLAGRRQFREEQMVRQPYRRSLSCCDFG